MTELTFLPLLLTLAPGKDFDVLSLITNAGLMVKLVMLVLILFSTISLSISWDRYKFFTKLKHQNLRFLKFFWKSDSLDEIAGVAHQYPYASTSHLYLAAMDELQQLNPSDDEDEEQKAYKLSAHGLENITQALYSAAADQRQRMEYRLSFLATTGSSAPFIGLFGTVWGIMNSFRGIASSGSANLAVVAPGIAEALIATAFGLLAAIPAVIAYNVFLSKIRSQTVQMDKFIVELLNIFRRDLLS